MPFRACFLVLCMVLSANILSKAQFSIWSHEILWILKRFWRILGIFCLFRFFILYSSNTLALDLSQKSRCYMVEIMFSMFVFVDYDILLRKCGIQNRIIWWEEIYYYYYIPIPYIIILIINKTVNKTTPLLLMRILLESGDI